MTATDAAAGTLTIPEQEGHVAATSIADLDTAIAELVAHEGTWIVTNLQSRIEMLDQALADTLAVSEEWGTIGARMKGISRGDGSIGEDTISGPFTTVRNLRLLRDTLIDIRDTGRPRPPKIETRDDGQVTVTAFPTGLVDQLGFPGFKGEVRIKREFDKAQVEAAIGGIYRDGGTGPGGTALVLGAGNVSSIPPMDVLYKLFAENRVCLLKMNPVNSYIGPVIAKAFKVFVDAGVLRIAYGGAEVGKYLTSHPSIDEIHITGSDKTHDAIVYGGGAEGARRKAADEPVNDKYITSELGNVSPVIVVPGPWSSGDLGYQGDSIASMLVNNAGFNCIAARVIITHKSWQQRGPLMDAVRDSLGRAERRMPYYPGARDRWEQFTEAHPEAETFGPSGEKDVPWTLIPDVDPTNTDDIAFTTEAFCGVFAETALDAPRSVAEYLDQAVDFCNNTLWGTLSASIIVHPRSMKDPEVKAAVERAIDRLEYGSIVINAWSATPYGAVSLPWGAYPGHTNQDIQSGRGVVHNSYLIADDQIEKVVLRAPFRMPIKPMLFHNHKKIGELAQPLVELEGTQDLKKLPKVSWLLARG